MKFIKANKNFKRCFSLLLYANVANAIWFFLSAYLEDNFFDRSYIFTLIGYLIIFSAIATILDFETSNKILFFFKMFFSIFCVAWALIISFFMSLYMILDNFIAYSVLALIYLMLFSVLLARMSNIKITTALLCHQSIILLITLVAYNFLDSIHAYDFGVQVLLSIWLFLVSLHITHLKLTAFSRQRANID